LVANGKSRIEIHPQVTRRKRRRAADPAQHRGSSKVDRHRHANAARWLKIPEFDKAYREARRAAYGQATARLQEAAGAAVSTLFKIMVDTNAPPSTRVRAADSVLNHAKQAIEIEDIEV
jgi:hypothetical protein